MAQNRTLWVWESLPKDVSEAQDRSWLKEGDAFENVHRLSMGGHQAGSFSSIVSGSQFPQTVQHDLDLLDLYGKLVKPGGQIKIVQAVSDKGANAGLLSATKLASNLKLAGLVNVQPFKTVPLEQEQIAEIRQQLQLTDMEDFQVIEIDCSNPSYECGSSTPLSFARKIKTSAQKKVWSLLDTDDDDVDLIDQDDLLEADDLKRPDEASLRVCGTTGQRKACKDCSCGLAEELAEGKAPPKKSVTSSCGSCYLGDAFRCASCPYLGMPAFKPGEKIQLSERQLKADQ